MAEVVVHERSDTQYQQNHEPGLAEDTIISSTRGTDHNQSPYEEVAVTFSTKLPESKMSLLSTKQQNPSSTDSSDTELGEGRIDEESSSEEEIDKDAFDKFGQSLNGETRINHAGSEILWNILEHWKSVASRMTLLSEKIPMILLSSSHQDDMTSCCSNV